MEMKRQVLFVLYLLTCLSGWSQVTVYPYPEGKEAPERSQDYEVSVRTAHGDWQPLGC